MKRAKIFPEQQNRSLSPSSSRKKKCSRVEERFSSSAKNCDFSSSDIKLFSDASSEGKTNLLIKEAGRSHSAFESLKFDGTSENIPDEFSTCSLSKEEEKVVAEYIKSNHDRQMPVNDLQVSQTINEIMCKKESAKVLCLSSSHPLKVKFSSQLLLYSFMKKYPKAQIKSSTTTQATKDPILQWFSDTYNYFVENDLVNVLKNPNQNFAIGETVVPINYGSFLGSSITNNKSKTSHYGCHISVLGCICADGKVPPPMIIYSAENPTAMLMDNVSESVSVGYSQNGYVTPSVLNNYFSKTFVNWLNKYNIKRPIIVWTDNYNSRKDFQLFEMLKREGIILYGLPNTAHATQPLSMGIFGSIKDVWGQLLDSWSSDSDKNIVHKLLPKLFFLLYFNRCTSVNNQIVFQETGLLPWNPDISCYSKYTQNHVNSSAIESNKDQMSLLYSIIDLIKGLQKNHEVLKVDQSTQTLEFANYNSKIKVSKPKESIKILQLKGFSDDSVVDVHCTRALHCEVNRIKAKMQFSKYVDSFKLNTEILGPASSSINGTPKNLMAKPLIRNKCVKFLKQKRLQKFGKSSVKSRSNLKIKKIALSYLTMIDLKRELKKREKNKVIIKRFKKGKSNECTLLEVEQKIFQNENNLTENKIKKRKFCNVDEGEYTPFRRTISISNMESLTDESKKVKLNHVWQESDKNSKSSPVKDSYVQTKNIHSVKMTKLKENDSTSEKLIDYPETPLDYLPASSSSVSVLSSSPLNVICNINETLSIPRKLVRGQDMWLPDGGEEASQILKCMQCHKSFQKFNDMISHMQQSHHNDTVPNKSESKFTANLSSILTCKECGLSFSSVRKMNIHIAKYGHHSKSSRVAKDVNLKKLSSQQKFIDKYSKTLSSNHTGTFSYGNQLDKALNAKIPCESCGDKIASQIFIEHVRMCRKIQDKNDLCNSLQTHDWKNLNLLAQSSYIDPLSEYYFKTIYNIDPLDYYYKAYFQNFKDIKRKKILENGREVPYVSNAFQNYYESHKEEILRNFLNPVHGLNSNNKDLSTRSIPQLDSEEPSKVSVSQDDSNYGSTEAAQEGILQSMLLKYYCLEMEKSSYNNSSLKPKVETLWYDHIMKQEPSTSHGTIDNEKYDLDTKTSAIKEEFNVNESTEISEKNVKKEVNSSPFESYLASRILSPFSQNVSSPVLSPPTYSDLKAKEFALRKDTPSGTFNPLAALQKLCETTETQNTLNPGCSEFEKIQNSLKEFSYACSENLKTNSVIRCAFCNTSFISKETYRLHLTKMHFVKDGNIPIAKPFV